MDGDSAALLGQPGHLHLAGALALEMGRHGQQRADRHHPGAADPGDQHIPRAGQFRQGGLGQVGQGELGRGARLRHCALDGDEAGAETLETGEILVAGGLVDLALAPERGLQRQDGDAVRLHPAVAAALADAGVDEDPAIGVGELAALAAAALLDGAGLDVEDGGDAVLRCELTLDGHQVGPLLHRHLGGQLRQLLLVVHYGDDALDARRQNLPRNPLRPQPALMRLSAGHRHRVVVEDLEGDVGPGCHRGADRHQAGMVVSAVAQVLEDVLAGGEFRFADPVGPLAAHMGEALGLAVHPLHHVVAADAGIGAGALGQAGRGVVRAAGAEPGLALGQFRLVARLGKLGEPLEARDHRRVRDALAAEHPAKALSDDHRIEIELDREQDIARLVLPAHHAGVARAAEQDFLELDLDDRALLLDHHDQVEPVGEFAQPLRLQRPDHADLVGGDAETLHVLPADAEHLQRMDHVEPAFPGRDNADARARRAMHPAVEIVRPRERLGGEALVIVQPRLLELRGVVQADVQPVRRHGEIGRLHQRQSVRIAVDHRGRLDRVLHRLDADPAAREAAHRPAGQHGVDQFLHPGRRQDRQHGVHQRHFGLVASGRALAGVVVAHRHQHAAVFGRAGEIGVAEHVTGAIDARPLAIPETEHPLVLAFAPKLRLLGAPECGRRQILVQAGMEPDLRVGEVLFRRVEHPIDSAQRRAAVAGDVAGGVEPRRRVAGALHQRRAHQRLGARQQHRRAVEVVTVR